MSCSIQPLASLQLQLPAGVDAHLAVTIIASITARQSLGLCDGHAALCRQLRWRTLCLDSTVRICMFGHTLDCRILSWTFKVQPQGEAPTLACIEGDTALSIVRPLPPPIPHASTLQQQLQEQLSSLQVSAHWMRRLAGPSLPVLVLVGAHDTSTLCDISRVIETMDCLWMPCSVVDAYRIQQDSVDSVHSTIERCYQLVEAVAPAIVLLTGLEILAQTTQTEDDARQAVIRQLCKALQRQQDGSAQQQVLTVCVVEKLATLPSELKQLLQLGTQLSIEPPSRMERVDIYRQYGWSDETQLADVARMTAGDSVRRCNRLARYARFLDQTSTATIRTPLLDAVGRQKSLSSSTQAITEPSIIPRGIIQLIGYEAIRRKLYNLLDMALLRPEVPARLGVAPPAGALLYGPPGKWWSPMHLKFTYMANLPGAIGCGKTMMARAAISEIGVAVFMVSGAQLFSKYFGETEHQLRQLFTAARRNAPCVVMIDEMDAIGVKRDTNMTEGTGVHERVLSTLLNEMDGVTGQSGVFVLACSSRPASIDDALLRPGRLDHLLYIGLPTSEERLALLQHYAGRIPGFDAELSGCVDATEGFTVAGLAQLVNVSALAAIREQPTHVRINETHVAHALSIVSISGRAGATPAMHHTYTQLQQRCTTK